MVMAFALFLLSFIVRTDAEAVMSVATPSFPLVPGASFGDEGDS